MTLGRFFAMAPPEQVAWGKAHLWPYVGRIMAAVADGIREVDPKAVFATHVSAIASLMPEGLPRMIITLRSALYKAAAILSRSTTRPAGTPAIPGCAASRARSPFRRPDRWRAGATFEWACAGERARAHRIDAHRSHRRPLPCEYRVGDHPGRSAYEGA